MTTMTSTQAQSGRVHGVKPVITDLYTQQHNDDDDDDDEDDCGQLEKKESGQSTEVHTIILAAHSPAAVP